MTLVQGHVLRTHIESRDQVLPASPICPLCSRKVCLQHALLCNQSPATYNAVCLRSAGPVRLYFYHRNESLNKKQYLRDTLLERAFFCSLSNIFLSFGPSLSGNVVSQGPKSEKRCTLSGRVFTPARSTLCFIFPSFFLFRILFLPHSTRLVLKTWQAFTIRVLLPRSISVL